MANNESALNMVGLGEASDYLASLLAAQPDPRSLYFGPPLEYGAAHQFGRPESNLPERRALGLSEGDKQSVLETLEGYLTPEPL